MRCSFTSFLWLILLMLSQETFSQVTGQIHFNAENHNMIDIQIDRMANNHVVFDGEDLYFSSLPGDPNLPYRHFSVLLPKDCDLFSLKIEMQDIKWKEIYGTYHVAPVPPLATRIDDQIVQHYPKQQQIEDGKNINVYETNNLFPDLDSINIRTGQKGTYKIATFNIPLIGYNPQHKKLYKITGGSFNLSYERNANNKGIDQHFYPKLDEDVLLTRESIESYSNSSRYNPNTISGYVILTTNSIVNNSDKLDEFINAKENMGYTVTLVTETQWGGGTGDAAAENIHSWLYNNYSNLSLEYLLLIGDPDPYDGDVPMKMLWPRHNYSNYKEAPSDYYYSDMTGNWDLDGDGYYGEWSDDTGTGGCDKQYEFIVGRIPYYGNMNELDAILTKSICFTYEPASQSSWRENVILPMEPSDASTPGYHLGEAINDDFVIPKAGWNSHRIYEEDYGLPNPPETTPCNYSNVYDAWIDSHPAVALWWTHGGYNVAADVMHTGYAALLNDSLPAFTFQCSCNNAYPDNSGNLAYALLKNGSAGTNAATRVSWYYSAQTNFNNSSSNSGMTYEYAERLIDNEETNGFSLYDLKEDLSYNCSELWMNFCVFNLYGDPSLSLFTSCRDTLQLYDASVSDGSWRFYAAANNLIFAGNINTYVADGTGNSGATVTATSDNSILFKPGFQAKSGSYFHAWIGDGCSPTVALAPTTHFLDASEETSESTSIMADGGNGKCRIYPNPSTGRVNIMFSDIIPEGMIRLIDLQGDELFIKSFYNTHATSIDLMNFAEEFYLLQISIPDQVITEKILKVNN
ncbi:MAG: T9SS type A sorting domain-containing protein [Bacteroidales bacterium]|nr:T9SS type A sorting domain-containing protein [Bacteroidales bacterium]MCF8350600.1 T9SS type A sorting domain-containing protein [Bacteroidales bacterium]MCF8377167.1 T9SS type A sorting domain-containing protein [Bacteroidales bacterium]